MGRLLQAEESAWCHSLIALGGCTCLGLQGRPYFATHDEMVRMLEGLVVHCVTQWQRRLNRPLHAARVADFLGWVLPLGTSGQGALAAVPAGVTAAALPAGVTSRAVRQLECGTCNGDIGGSLFPVWARQGTWVHARALPHAWGTVVLALSGDGPGSCQLLPIRAHRPPGQQEH